MTRTIAHRGFAGCAPENTIAATRFAAEQGADLIELDVMPSADGEVVVFHDNRLDDGDGSRGITDGEGLVWETPFDEIARAEVLDSGETVPALATVLEACPDHIGVNIELKNPGTPELQQGRLTGSDAVAERAAVWEPFVRSVFNIVDQHPNDALFSSFAAGALAALRSIAPEAHLAPLVYERLERALELADRYRAVAVHPSILAFEDEEANQGFLERARRGGYDVNVWTVDTWRQAAQAESLDVDGVIADYPGLFEWRSSAPA